MITFHTIWTAVLFIIFIGIIVWAMNRRQKQRFDSAAQIPFKHDDLDSQERDEHHG